MKQSEDEIISFKLSAKAFIEQESLDSEKLNHFEALLAGDALGSQHNNGQDNRHYSEPVHETQARLLPPKLSSPYHRRWYALSAFTASIVLVLILNVLSPTERTELSLSIANEVAMNHIKMKPLEFKTNSMAPLRDYFTALDFSVVGSRLLSKQSNTMLGGRYCSIQGVTAAQIRYETDKGQKITLYEVGYDARLYGELPNIDSGEIPLSIDVKGINVSLWIEKGLLMAEVKNID